MFTVAPFLAAMTIAGAFWVGLIAARRLREWGECQDALEGEPERRALASATGAPSSGAASMRIRTKVAEEIEARLRAGGWTSAELAPRASNEEVSLATLRLRDLVCVEGVESHLCGDFLVDAILHLRESGQTAYVVGLVDGPRRRWLVAHPQSGEYFVVQTRDEHGLVGEPPRNLAFDDAKGRRYHLARRGQASTAQQGATERPELPRLSYYIYRAAGRDALWLERWGDEVLVFEGSQVPEAMVSFMPGTV